MINSEELKERYKKLSIFIKQLPDGKDEDGKRMARIQMDTIQRKLITGMEKIVEKSESILQ